MVIIIIIVNRQGRGIGVYLQRMDYSVYLYQSTILTILLEYFLVLLEHCNILLVVLLLPNTCIDAIHTSLVMHC